MLNQMRQLTVFHDEIGFQRALLFSFMLQQLHIQMKNQGKGQCKQRKESDDECFDPQQQAIRPSYRKISKNLKKLIVEQYFHQKVKMAKLVKRYKLHYSTIINFLRKHEKEIGRAYNQDIWFEQKAQQNKLKIEYIEPLEKSQIEKNENDERSRAQIYEKQEIINLKIFQENSQIDYIYYN